MSENLSWKELQDRPFWTAKEVAWVMAMTPDALRTFRRNAGKDFPLPFKPGKRHIYSAAEVTQYIEKSRQLPENETEDNPRGQTPPNIDPRLLEYPPKPRQQLRPPKRPHDVGSQAEDEDRSDEEDPPDERPAM